MTETTTFIVLAKEPVLHIYRIVVLTPAVALVRKNLLLQKDSGLIDSFEEVL